MLGNIWQRQSGKKKYRKAVAQRTRLKLGAGLRLESLETRALLDGSALGTGGIANDPATHLAVFTPPMAQAGAAVPVVVVALDANNLPTSDFSDTISLASTDGSATIAAGPSTASSPVPYDYTFQSSNNGHQLFYITYGANTTGAQTLTVSDTTDTTVTDDTATTNLVTPSAATHFAIFIQPNVQAGSPANVLVEALDANNQPVPNYEGTITLSSSDTSATVNTDNGQLTLPQSYTFTADDHGRHQFQVTLNATGAQTITADDSTNSLTGTGTTNVDAPQVATHFGVWIAPNAIAGVPTTVQVVALDANNHPVHDYTGPVTFSVSNDPTATLPAGYTFQASDHGHTSFQVTFDTTGPQTVSVQDANDAVTGSATTNVTSAPVATQFLLVLPANVPAGVPVNGFIVPLDASGQPVPNYTGTVSFSSTDGGATLPATITFPSTSTGPFQSFTVTFATTGSQSLTATGTDADGNTITTSATTNVTAPQVPTSLAIEAPQNATVGLPVLVKVDVLDANGNPIKDFAGQITLTSGDSAATIVPLAAVTALGAPSNLFIVVFGTTGSQSLTATDTTDSLTISISVNVTPGILDPPGGPKTPPGSNSNSGPSAT